MSAKRITKHSYCGICLAACGVEVDIEDNKVVEVRRDKSHKLSKGFLCLKGKNYGVGHDELRVTSPYERVGKKWHEISWDEAYQKISARLQTILKENGKTSLATYYGAGDPLSSMNLLPLMSFVNGLGSPRIYNVLSLEFTNMFYTFEKMYGRQYRTSQPDLENTKYLIIFGHNPLISIDHPDIVRELKNFKKRNARIVVVDPRQTETAGIADIHIPIKPGTDLYFLQAIYHYIFSEKLQDKIFLKKYTKNSDFFKPDNFMTPEEASPITGVEAALIKTIAHDFATAETANAIGKLGITASRNSTVTYWLMEALNTVTGNLDKPGGLIFNPGVFNLDLLLWLSNYGKRPRSALGNFPYMNGGQPASELPREILSDTNPIKALIVSCGNPALAFPNSTRTVKALKQLDLLISIDVYMNETAQLADFFLPSANYWERDDFYITFPLHQPYPFGQWMPALVKPEGNAKPQWLIFRELSRKMNVPIMNKLSMDILFRVGSIIGRMIGKSELFDFNPKSYYRIMTTLFGKVKMSQLLANPQGVKGDSIHFGKALRRIGKINVAPDEFIQGFRRATIPSTSSTEYPFSLLTGERQMYQKSTSLRGIKALTDRLNKNYLRIHPNDAADLSIKKDQMVKVKTKNGSIKIKALIDDGIRQGVVSMAHGWGRKIKLHPNDEDNLIQGANANELTDDRELDSFVGMPIYNAIPCSVYPLETQA